MAYRLLLGEETEGLLANTEKTPRSPETCPLLLSMNPRVVRVMTQEPSKRDRDLPKATLPDLAVCADWSRAPLYPPTPGPTGMSGVTQGPKGQLLLPPSSLWVPGTMVPSLERGGNC